jgi:aryl-alcohol dehydrogenase-like predicted oxidoreductase
MHFANRHFAGVNFSVGKLFYQCQQNVISANNRTKMRTFVFLGGSECFGRGFNIVDVMRPIADAHAVSVAQVAIAWLLHQKVVSSVILGAKYSEQLADNLKASELVLDADEIAKISAAGEMPAEYPGWMFGFWSELRRNQLAHSNR